MKICTPMLIDKKKLRILLAEIAAHETETIALYKHIALFGPSGAGKTSLIRHKKSGIIARLPHIYDFSISAATRDLWEGKEIDGIDYFHFSKTAFLQQEFLECNKFKGNGNLYGTLYSEVHRIAVVERKRVVYDLDLNGAKNLQKIFSREELLTVYIHTPLDVLEKRLVDRNREKPEQITRRIATALEEQRLIKDGYFVPGLVLPYSNGNSLDEAVNDAVDEIVKHAYIGER